MNVSLHADLQSFVDQQVKAGHYDSAEDLINLAVARLQAEEDLSAAGLDDLRAQIAVGTEESDRGETAAWDPEAMKQRVLIYVASQVQPYLPRGSGFGGSLP